MFETNNYVPCLTVDFSKAFDTVNHNLLLHKLNDLDLPDFVYNWLVSFLIGRSQTCIVDGVCSPVVDITRVLFKDLA